MRVTNIEAGAARRVFIVRYFERMLADEKRAPTMDEIAAEVGLASKSTVHKHLLTLVDEGLLARREMVGGKGVYTLP